MNNIAVMPPVYKSNKEPYLHLSFDSIVNQTYADAISISERLKNHEL